MKNLISRLGLALSGYDFFQEKYLCESKVASLRFNSALTHARKYYAARSQEKIAPELIHESWQQNLTALESYFASSLNENFMSNEVINGTMVFTNRKAHKLELGHLSRAMGKDNLEEIISKNLSTAFLSGKSLKSTLINSTHHLYHLIRFEQCTGKKINSLRSVVEFGGGYGNMARIIRNMSPCQTYSIVDLLLFSCIQYVYLSTVAGNELVAFHDESPERDAKIVLHPLLRADMQTYLRGELFLSTWALSESTRAAYEWVLARDWFGSTSLLLAYNDNWKPWQEGELEKSLANSGWSIIKEPIEFLPDSFYLFATR